jgi:hypothetical protein
VVNLTLGAVWLIMLGVLVLTGRTRGADYTAFYTGWRLVLEGQGNHLYDAAAQAAMQRQILGGQTFEAGLNPFNNPPHMVLPFLPLGMLPLEISFLVWTAIQLALGAVVLRMLLRGPARDWRPVERLALAGWLVGFPSLGISLWQGSFSLLLVLGVLGTFLALGSSRDRLGGLALVVASIKPQGMVAPGFAVLVGRRWRAVGAAALGGGILAAAATAVLGVGIWADYLRFLSEYTSSFDRYSVDPSVMWNLRGTLTLLLGRDQASVVNTLGLAGLAIGMLAVACLWRGGWSPALGTRGIAARFGLTIVIGLFASPHLNPHDDLLLVIAAVLAYAAWRDHQNGRWLAIVIGLAPAAILLVNGMDAAAPTTLPVRLPTVAIVALAVVLILALRRARPGAAGETAVR